LQESPDGSFFIAVDSKAIVIDHPIIYRFGAPLYQVNASVFSEEIDELIQTAPEPVKWIVLDTESIADIDPTGADALRQTSGLLSNRGIKIAISRANRQTSDLLVHYGLREHIDEDSFYPTNRHAMARIRESNGK